MNMLHFPITLEHIDKRNVFKNFSDLYILVSKVELDQSNIK